MLNIPTPERLSKIPKLYETESIPTKEKMIYLHFFLGGCDWFVAEYDGDDLFFGYAVLGGDWQNAEWGYTSFNELKDIRVHGVLHVDCELEECWKIRPFIDVMSEYAPKKYRCLSKLDEH